jgi:hypothetical protein
MSLILDRHSRIAMRMEQPTSIRIPDPSDLSALLFQKETANYFDSSYNGGVVVEPYLGPIQISTTHVRHGRGLTATRDVSPGECLLVLSPTVSCAVDIVKQQYMAEESLSSSSAVEAISEQVLVQAMKTVLQKDPAAANSFLTLMGGTKNEHDVEEYISLDRLLGMDFVGLEPKNDVAPTDSDLLQIIRNNAFGPDFVTYAVIARRWKKKKPVDDNGCNSPSRILGIYPLAAMINHSCDPNALRVYCGEVMVVHAIKSIPAGEEIVWSYLPPTRPFLQRQSALLQQHGFVCSCPRCDCERPFWSSESSSLESIATLVATSSTFTSEEIHDPLKTVRAVRSLEDEILVAADSNELRRYIRVGFMDLYIHYLNAVLAKHADSDENLLILCTHLHFSFCACDNASTEHLSVSLIPSFTIAL